MNKQISALRFSWEAAIFRSSVTARMRYTMWQKTQCLGREKREKISKKVKHWNIVFYWYSPIDGRFLSMLIAHRSSQIANRTCWCYWMKNIYNGVSIRLSSDSIEELRKFVSLFRQSTFHKYISFNPRCIRNTDKLYNFQKFNITMLT